MDVGEWLRSFGLEQYASAFRENGINGRVLPKLTAKDLKDLGISLIGHRRLLLEAIAAVNRPSLGQLKGHSRFLAALRADSLRDGARRSGAARRSAIAPLRFAGPAPFRFVLEAFFRIEKLFT